MTPFDYSDRIADHKPGAVPPPAPNVYHGIPFADYLAWAAISNTDLKAFATSPAQWIHSLLHPWVPSKKAILGSATDCGWIEGPEAFERDYQILPESIRARRGKAFDAFVAAAEGRTCLLAHEADNVRNRIAALEAHPLARLIRDSADCQASIVWHDQETGLPCKARLDLYVQDLGPVLANALNESLDPMTEIYAVANHPAVWDLKCSGSVNPDQFARVCDALRYHWQAGHYSEGIETLTGRFPRWGFVTCRDEPEHSVEVYSLSDRAVDLGRTEIRAVKRTAAACLESGNFPSSAGTVSEIDLPGWAYKREI